MAATAIPSSMPELPNLPLPHSVPPAVTRAREVCEVGVTCCLSSIWWTTCQLRRLYLLRRLLGRRLGTLSTFGVACFPLFFLLFLCVSPPIVYLNGGLFANHLNTRWRDETRSSACGYLGAGASPLPHFGIGRRNLVQLRCLSRAESIIFNPEGQRHSNW